jgi:hypothetical protein
MLRVIVFRSKRPVSQIEKNSLRVISVASIFARGYESTSCDCNRACPIGRSSKSPIPPGNGETNSITERHHGSSKEGRKKEGREEGRQNKGREEGRQEKGCKERRQESSKEAPLAVCQLSWLN